MERPAAAYLAPLCMLLGPCWCLAFGSVASGPRATNAVL